jgi:hypothetical protein
VPDKHPFSIVHEDDALGHVPADFDDIAGAEQDVADHITRCGTVLYTGDTYNPTALHELKLYNPARAKRERQEYLSARQRSAPLAVATKLEEKNNTRETICPGDQFEITKPGDPLQGAVYSCRSWELVKWSGLPIWVIVFRKAGGSRLSYAKPEWCELVRTQ